MSTAVHRRSSKLCGDLTPYLAYDLGQQRIFALFNRKNPTQTKIVCSKGKTKKMAKIGRYAYNLTLVHYELLIRKLHQFRLQKCSLADPGIPDPNFFHPGSRIQGSKRHRICNTAKCIRRYKGYLDIVPVEFRPNFPT